MTGKQIAANLRKSRRRWRTGYLCWNKAYCVLGLKAREAGVPDKVLRAFDNLGDGFPDNIYPLVELNDNAGSKENLVSTLETSFSKRHFPVERFIKTLKANAKKYLRRAK